MQLLAEGVTPRCAKFLKEGHIALLAQPSTCFKGTKHNDVNTWASLSGGQHSHDERYATEVQRDDLTYVKKAINVAAIYLKGAHSWSESSGGRRPKCGGGSSGSTGIRGSGFRSGRAGRSRS